jgi:hypothetical protein
MYFMENETFFGINFRGIDSLEQTTWVRKGLGSRMLMLSLIDIDIDVVFLLFFF